VLSGAFGVYLHSMFYGGNSTLPFCNLWYGVLHMLPAFWVLAILGYFLLARCA